MAFVLESPSNNFKHFCKICKKGFMCGRALGGHMRAHGIGDDGADFEEDDDPASDWDQENVVSTPPDADNKRMYALRTNPNRMRTCRACENCGKEFLSWKSFLEHRMCGSEGDDAESPVSSPSSDDESAGRVRGGNSSKRRRTCKAEVEGFPLTEEEDLANCLMMLSNAAVEPAIVADQLDDSSISASKGVEERHLINFVATRAPPPTYGKAKGDNNNNNNNNNRVGLFECKACKKVFNSHQALGGHRASHKKVKGCFAARQDHIESDRSLTDEGFLRPLNDRSVSKGKAKVHECSICHRVFSSGQALGGHKRFHWITPSSTNASTLARFQQLRDRHVGSVQTEQAAALDLNLPASNLLSLKVSTEFFLQPWGGANTEEVRHHRNEENNQRTNVDKMNNDTDNNNNNNNNHSFELSRINVDDEVDSKVKLAKLSELKDVNMAGGSSPWLQVGIGSGNGVGDL